MSGSQPPEDNTKPKEIRFEVTFGGKKLIVQTFEVTGSSYGSVGSASMVTSLAALQEAKVDLFDTAVGAAGMTEVAIFAIVDGKRTRIFGGEYLSMTWDFDYDKVHLRARSWAGVLVDQRRILTKIAKAVIATLRPLAPGRVSAAGISNSNQTVGQIVEAIAAEFGFNPVLRLTQTKGNPTVGTLYGAGDQTYMPAPQSLWAILCTLARDTGYVVYDTPNKDLVFGEPGEGLDTIKVSYNRKPSKGEVPSRLLRVEHHPRRNSTFRVLVISYDPARSQTIIGRASYVGENFAGSRGLTAGLSTGSGSDANDKKLVALNKGVGANSIPLYTFHHDGLTQEQAEAMAGSIATDIAKREMILDLTLDGFPIIEPTQKLKLTGPLPDQITASDFYTSGFTHRFDMPNPASQNSQGGFSTHIKALNIPTQALATANAG